MSGVVGYAMLFGVTLAIGDLPAAAAAANPFLYVLREALGPGLGGALVWIVIGAMWFCGLSSVTSNSRMLFAFARDGGLPGSEQLSRVSPRFRSPHVAIWVSVAAAFVVALWSGAYAAMVALSTMALYASYALPILVGLRARRNGAWPTAARGTWAASLARQRGGAGLVRGGDGALRPAAQRARRLHLRGRARPADCLLGGIPAAHLRGAEAGPAGSGVRPGHFEGLSPGEIC